MPRRALPLVAREGLDFVAQEIELLQSREGWERACQPNAADVVPDFADRLLQPTIPAEREQETRGRQRGEQHHRRQQESAKHVHSSPAPGHSQRDLVRQYYLGKKAVEEKPLWNLAG